MSAVTKTYTCYACGHTTDWRNDFYVVHPLSGFNCKSVSACNRRQRRDQIMAGSPFSPQTLIQTHGAMNLGMALILVACGLFLLAVIAAGLFFVMGF